MSPNMALMGYNIPFPDVRTVTLTVVYDFTNHVNTCRHWRLLERHQGDRLDRSKVGDFDGPTERSIE